MRLLNTRTDPERAVLAALTQGASHDLPEVEAVVRDIIADVRARGDAAVRDCLRRFDGVDPVDLEVTRAEMEAAAAALPPETLAALDRAAANVRAFHARQRPEGWTWDAGGARLGQLVRPLDAVGVHVPAGRAPLPSTLLMTVLPARAAGVGQVVVCSAPRKDGGADPTTLAAALLSGVDRFFKVGGAQAVAAMAYGTETIPRVDKIVGPGNVYTVMAKRLVFGAVGIESLAGPTEVVIIADGTANPAWLAADLLSQAEHGADSVAVLLTPDADLAHAVAEAISAQVPRLSRQETIRRCLADRGWIIVTRDLEEACDLANLAAPEHLELVVNEPEPCLGRIRHAGAIFVGSYTPEPVGDYMAGPSHVLPTGGTARFSSPLSVDDFVKKTSLIEYDRSRFLLEAEDIIRLAEAETLDAHAASIRIRVQGSEAGRLGAEAKRE